MNLTELIRMCPHCYKGVGRGLTDNGKRVGREVDIYAEYNKDDVLHNIYIFGDDDFDMPSDMGNITEIGISNDQKHVSDVVCPRCKEHVSVNIPIVRTRKKVRSIGEENEEKSFKQVG